MPYQNCNAQPTTVRPIIHAYREDWNNEFARWWPRDVRYVLAPGSATLTIPLDYTAWSSVNGKVDQAQFKQALRNVSSLGVTFGTDCFFGHGIQVQNGSATFSVTSYQIF